MVAGSAVNPTRGDAMIVTAASGPRRLPGRGVPSEPGSETPPGRSVSEARPATIGCARASSVNRLFRPAFHWMRQPAERSSPAGARRHIMAPSGRHQRHPNDTPCGVSHSEAGPRRQVLLPAPARGSAHADPLTNLVRAHRDDSALIRQDLLSGRSRNPPEDPAATHPPRPTALAKHRAQPHASRHLSTRQESHVDRRTHR